MKPLPALAALLCAGTLAWGAQLGFYATPPTPAQIAAQVAPLVPNDYLGSYTVATLPSPSSYAGKRATVTDLGGLPGGDVRSTGSCWKRETSAALPTVVPASANVTGQALVISSLIQMTAPSNLLASVNVSITGLCPGDVETIYMPNGVMAAAGTLGVSLNGASAITVTGIGSAYSADFLWTGTVALKIRGGPVQ